MTLRRIAFAAAALWLAGNALTKRRPGAALATALPAGAGRRHQDDARGAASTSPNEGERLQARGIATPVGNDDELFASTSQESATARAPGLPDFFRGA